MHVLVPRHIRDVAARGVRRDQSVGAALVVDAEGSTALSARLQPHGTAGAEALADVLSAVFSPMVDHVVSQGGFIAEFAGDGFVAVFLGEPDRTVPHAAEAACRIMADLGGSMEFAAPDGPAHLLVRAVVGAGSIDWMVWTTDRTDAVQNATYAYTGSAVTEARCGEAMTPGGVVAAGPTACSHLPDSVKASPLDDGFVALRVPGDKVGGSEPKPLEQPLPDDGLRFFPPSVTEATHRGEFRDLVSVFTEFRSVPDSSSDSAMVRLLDLLADHHGFVCNVVQPDPKSEGVRVLAFWGAPTSHERDIGYALRFVADVRLASGADQVRAGLTRSTAYAGFVGGERQESYTGIGFGVNLAARMCAKAEWGEIRVDERIAARLDDPWELDDLGALEYRGFDHPIRTHRVTFVPPVRRADPFEGAFVGRRTELDQLEDLLAPLWSGRPAGVVAVAGEAGIGKSRLIAALRERVARRRPPPVWLEAQADEIRTRPFATLRDAFAGYFGRPGRRDSGDRLATYLRHLQEDVPELAVELDRSRQTFGDLLELEADVSAVGHLDPGTRYDNLVFALESVVLAVERSAPVILSVADGQWIDTGTAEILDRLRHDLEDARIVVLVETRNPETGLRADHRVDVGSLTTADISELAMHYLQSPPSEALVALLADRSGGNAFYVRQLLDYLQRESSSGSIDLSPHGENVPMDLRRILVSRLDGLPGRVRRLVQTASVLGRDVDLGILRLIAEPDDDFAAHVAEAVAAGIWEPMHDGHVSFTDLLARDAAYGMLLQSDLTSLHRAAADAIAGIHGDGERTAAELAYHFDRANERDAAADHYVAAGRFAAGRYANGEALTHLERALELLDPKSHERRCETLRVIFDVYDVMGDREAQQETLQAMRTVADDPALEIDLAILQAKLLTSTGSYPEAQEVVSDASVCAADLGLDERRGHLAFLRAQLARYVGDTGEAREAAAEAAHAFAESGNELRVATVDDFVGGVAYDLGDFESAAMLHRSAAEVFRKAGRVNDEVRALNNLGSAIFAMGDYAAARIIHEDGAARSRDIGYRMGEGDHLDNVGGTAWAVGDYDLAIERYTAALEIRQRMNDAWGIAISKSNLAAALRATGRHDEALVLYREALDVDRHIGRRRGEAYDLHGIGLCHLDLGRYNLASEALGDAAAIRDELGEHHLAHESQAACAVAMLRRGDRDDAVALVEQVLAAEGDSLFEGAVETTASLLRCIEVLEASAPERANALRAVTAAKVRERAERISDPLQRASYLEGIESHRRARIGSS